MESLRIGILSEDTDHAAALAAGLTAVRRDMIVSVIGRCGADRRDGHGGAEVSGADVYLVDEDLSDAFSDKEKMIVLCRDRKDTHSSRKALSCASGAGGMAENENSRFRLFRYANAREIAAGVMYFCTCRLGMSLPYVEKGRVRLYGFVSPAGGTGCTSVALATAQELQRFHGRRVFYISMEQVSSAPDHMRSVSGGRTVAEYLYHCLGRGRDMWKTGDGVIGSFISRMSCGVETVTASEGRNPLPYLEREDIPGFMRSIVESGRYDTVIIDAGSGLAAQITDMLDLCDGICLIKDPERCGRREEIYIKHLKALIRPDLAESMITAENRRSPERADERQKVLDEIFTDDEDDAENEEEEKEAADAVIDHDPSSFRKEDGLISISSDGDFGLGVKVLTEKLIAGQRYS